jgi:hypothetical protein
VRETPPRRGSQRSARVCPGSEPRLPPPRPPTLPLRPRTHRPCDRRYSITISLLAVFALVKVLSAVGILDVD